MEKAGYSIDRSFGSFLGDYGVAIFFTISGFVIIHSHSGDFNRPGAPLRFFLKRIGRIVPLYWLITVLYSLKLVLTGATLALGSFLLSLFFIPQQLPDAIYGRPVYELGWTLQYEMAFYITVALALCLNFRVGIVLIAGIFLTLTGLNAGGYLGSANPLAYLGAPIVLYFLAGVAIAFARHKLSSDFVAEDAPWVLGSNAHLLFSADDDYHSPRLVWRRAFPRNIGSAYSSSRYRKLRSRCRKPQAVAREKHI